MVKAMNDFGSNDFGSGDLEVLTLEGKVQDLERWTRQNIEAKEQARVNMQQQIDLLIRGTTMLRDRLDVLEEVARAAGAIRKKVNGQLQAFNADHWLGPELRRLDAALKALEE